jgi:hypothetical protein
MSTRAIAGVINHNVGASTVVLTIPNKGDHANCMSIEDIKNLTTTSTEDDKVDDETSTTSKGRSRKKNFQRRRW